MRLTILLLGICLFQFNASISIFAYPDSFTITSACDPWGGGEVEGAYTRHATDVDGCPCYDGPNGSLKKTSFGDWGFFGAPCPSPHSASVIYDLGPDVCDISTAIASTICDPANSLILPTSTASIPTLSEWGLINLALLLLTFGTIYLINPSFSLRKRTIKG